MADDWAVIGQGQGKALTALGGLIDVWTVTFQSIPAGTLGSVDIPLATWKADPAGATAAAVQPLVDALNETAAL